MIAYSFFSVLVWFFAIMTNDGGKSGQKNGARPSSAAATCDSLLWAIYFNGQQMVAGNRILRRGAMRSLSLLWTDVAEKPESGPAGQIVQPRLPPIREARPHSARESGFPLRTPLAVPQLHSYPSHT